MRLKVPQRVLLVCTANQCRSAAAEAFLRRKLDMQRLSIEVSSAGMDAVHQSRALSDTVAAMAAMGYDLSEHTSRQVTTALLDQHDLILPMARVHMDRIAAIHRPALDRTFLFRPYAQGRPDQARKPLPEDDIDDPVGKPPQVHRQVMELLELHCTQLVRLWQTEMSRKRWW